MKNLTSILALLFLSSNLFAAAPVGPSEGLVIIHRINYSDDLYPNPAEQDIGSYVVITTGNGILIDAYASKGIANYVATLPSTTTYPLVGEIRVGSIYKGAGTMNCGYIDVKQGEKISVINVLIDGSGYANFHCTSKVTLDKK